MFWDRDWAQPMKIIIRIAGPAMAAMLAAAGYIAVQEDVVRQGVRELRRSEWFRGFISDQGLGNFERFFFGSVNDLEIIVFVVFGGLALSFLEKIGVWLSSILPRDSDH